MLGEVEDEVFTPRRSATQHPVYCSDNLASVRLLEIPRLLK